MSRTLALLIGSALVTAAPDASADPARLEFFESKVRPILAEHCLGCHGAGKQKAGLRLDTRAAMMRGGESGPILKPGAPEASRLIEVIRYGGDVQMPPKRKLSEAEIDVLTRWIKMGAEWPETACNGDSAARHSRSSR